MLQLLYLFTYLFIFVKGKEECVPPLCCMRLWKPLTKSPSIHLVSSPQKFTPAGPVLGTCVGCNVSQVGICNMLALVALI